MDNDPQYFFFWKLHLDSDDRETLDQLRDEIQRSETVYRERHEVLYDDSDSDDNDNMDLF